MICGRHLCDVLDITRHGKFGVLEIEYLEKFKKNKLQNLVIISRFIIFNEISLNIDVFLLP